MFPIRDLNPTRLTPYVTLLLTLANVLVFVFWQPHSSPASDEFLYRHAAIACEITTGHPLTAQEIRSDRCVPGTTAQPLFPAKNPVESMFVSMFLHAGIVHILGNMWFLWLFGNNVEEAFGRLRYLVLYLVGGLLAGLAFVLAHPDSTTPVLGASGAIAAVLGAYFVLYPTKLVLSLVFIVLIPIPAVIFLGFWFAAQFLLGQPGVAWEAHVAGFLFGAAVALVFRGPLLHRVHELNRPRWRPEAL